MRSAKALLWPIACLTAAMVVLACGVLAVLVMRRAPTGAPEIVIPRGHAGQIQSIAWSPDGKSLATAGEDNNVKVWDAGSGVLINTAAGFTGEVDIAWSADSREVAIDGPGKTISLWNMQPDGQTRTAVKSSDPIYTFAWSPDRTMFAAIVKQGYRSDLYLRIWRASTGDVIATIGEFSDTLRALAWTPDSKAVVAAGSTVKLYQADTGILLRVFHPDDKWNIWEHAAISPDGRILAEAGNGWLYVRQMDTGAVLWTSHERQDYFPAMEWSPDGRTLATGGVKSVRLWRADSGALLRTLGGQSKCVCALAWRPDGKAIAATGDDGSAMLWSAESGALERTLAGHPNSVESLAWSPDGRTLASGSYDHSVKLWNAGSGTLVRSLSGHPSEVSSVAWRPDGKMLASGGEDDTAKVWDASSGALLHTFTGNDPKDPDYSRFPNPVIVAWRPDGTTLSAAGLDAFKVRLWGAASGTLLRDLTAPDNRSFYSLSWSPDGRHLAAGSTDILIWRGESGALLANHPMQQSTPSRLVAFSPDGKMFASVGAEGPIDLLSTSPIGQEAMKPSIQRQTIANHIKSRAVAWSPDGRLLAVANDDGAIRIWRGDSGAPEWVLSGHDGYVGAVAWSPDGQTLASGGGDATIRLWHVASGELESVTSLLPRGEWITVVPKNLLYSSSPHGDDYAKLRFGALPQSLYPLSTRSYRSRLNRSGVRAMLTQPRPDLHPDYIKVASEIERENVKAGSIALFLYLAAFGLIVAVPLRFRWMLSGSCITCGLAAGLYWISATTPRAKPTITPTAASPKTLPPVADEKPHPPKMNSTDGLRYVWVPPGSFLMGCSPGDNQCPGEGTYAGLHEEGHGFNVTISKGFWMGETEVTAGAFKRFAKATGQEMPTEAYIFGVINPGWSDEALPMINVTWNEAKSYCEWAGMRLPTEAEWERAARGGSQDARYGNVDDIAWWSGNARAADGSQAEAPMRVGLKQPNAYGLFDMLGNVRNWVADWYGATYYDTGPRLDPQGPATGKQRMIRGASWHSGSDVYVRVSTRYSARPEGRDSRGQVDEVDVGFRCAGN